MPSPIFSSSFPPSLILLLFLLFLYPLSSFSLRRFSFLFYSSCPSSCRTFAPSYPIVSCSTSFSSSFGPLLLQPPSLRLPYPSQTHVFRRLIFLPPLPPFPTPSQTFASFPQVYVEEVRCQVAHIMCGCCVYLLSLLPGFREGPLVVKGEDAVCCGLMFVLTV